MVLPTSISSNLIKVVLHQHGQEFVSFILSSGIINHHSMPKDPFLSGSWCCLMVKKHNCIDSCNGPKILNFTCISRGILVCFTNFSVDIFYSLHNDTCLWSELNWTFKRNEKQWTSVKDILYWGKPLPSVAINLIWKTWESTLVWEIRLSCSPWMRRASTRPSRMLPHLSSLHKGVCPHWSIDWWVLRFDSFHCIYSMVPPSP